MQSPSALTQLPLLLPGGLSPRGQFGHISRMSSGHESTFSLDLSSRPIRTPASEKTHELPDSYNGSAATTPRSPGPAAAEAAAGQQAQWQATLEAAGAVAAPSGLLLRRVGLATDEGASWTLGKAAAANGADGMAELYLRGGPEAEGLMLGGESHFSLRSMTAPERVQEPVRPAGLAKGSAGAGDMKSALPATGLDASDGEALL